MTSLLETYPAAAPNQEQRRAADNQQQQNAHKIAVIVQLIDSKLTPELLERDDIVTSGECDFVMWRQIARF
jgi:hypothetical protein